MSRDIASAERLGRTANLLIFLGLFYSLLHLVSWLAPDLLHYQGYGMAGLGTALGVIGLGYGIRYGSMACLSIALVFFAGLSLTSLVLYVSAGKLSVLVRYALSSWATYRLYRSLGLMRSLRHSNAFPLPMSRYGAMFLKRWQHDNASDPS